MIIGGQMMTQDFEDSMKVTKKMDEFGFGRVWTVDSQMLWQDSYVYGTSILAQTENIVWGTAVSNPVLRHYSVSASAVATLDDLHPGRAILGIGRGDSAVRTLGYRPMPTAEIEGTLRKTRKLLDGVVVDEDGSDVYLRWKQDHGRIPLMYAATGPTNLRIAGRVAEIVQLQVGTHPAAVEWAISQVHEGAKDEGRDPKDINISLLCGMWVSDDIDEARKRTRWAASCATNHLEEVQRAGKDKVLPSVLSDVLKKKRDQYDYYGGHLDSKAEHSDYLSDEMIDDFSITGTADVCLEKIKVLEDLGVGEISSGYYNGCIDQVEKVGREIVPHV